MLNKHSEPYRALPNALMCELGKLAAEKLNQFPAKAGVSEHCSFTIVMGNKPIHVKDCMHPFGTFAVAHNNKTDNIMRKQALDAVCIKANTNTQGGHVVMNLNAGKRITGSRAAKTPATQTVVDHANQMTKKDGHTDMRFAAKSG